VYLPAKELKILPDYYPPLIEKLNWQEVFANGLQADSLDIGCGKGAFLLDYAQSHPTENILGIEVRKLPAKWLRNVIEGENLTNCAVLWYSAVNGFAFIESGTIQKAFYLYPDPWFKNKHKKRRLFSPDFINEIHRILKIYGLLYLATDVEEVHFFQKEIIKERNNFEIIYLKENYLIEQDNDECWQLPLTNKEQFCKKKHIPVYRTIYKKI
jgi:tRNA (guanine-N7-)-methyltransferase